MFTRGNRGDRVVVERNPNSGEPVYADRLIYRLTPNPAQRTTALETGEVDVVFDFYLSKTDVPRLQQTKAVRVRHGQPIPALDFMFINTRRGALANVKVRQALAFAINRKQIAQGAGGGVARPGKGPLGEVLKYAYTTQSDFPRLYP